MAPSRHDVTLSKRKKQQQKTCKPELARTPGFGPSVFSSFFSEYWENILHKILFWINRKHCSSVTFLLSLVDCSEN